MSALPSAENPWARLRALTPARIALGSAGVSLPTAQHLAFQLAHARARDAVHCRLDVGAIVRALDARGLPALALHSAAGDRPIYLQRPDQGRCLDAASRQSLARLQVTRRGVTGQEQVREHQIDQTQCGQTQAEQIQAEPHDSRSDLALVIADGLSARAVQEHAMPLLDALLPLLRGDDWSLAPVTVVEQGRVAVGDEIGVLLNAANVVVLIGERPGLSSPDSLGIYFSHAPRIGMRDAERNCISNIRPAGLGFAPAAETLRYLLGEARRRGLSGVMLKDETTSPVASARLASGNFLLGSG